LKNDKKRESGKCPCREKKLKNSKNLCNVTHQDQYGYQRANVNKSSNSLCYRIQ